MTRDDRCVHDFRVGECAICGQRPSEPAPADRPVWVLPTSEVFHRRDCYMFDATHESNIVRGSHDSPPAALRLDEARARGLRPCELCSPAAR